MVNPHPGAKRVRPSGLLALSSVIVFVSMGAAPASAPHASAATAAAATAAAAPDCATWTPVVTPNDSRLQAVDEISPNDVWAVGPDTVHWDGHRWARVASPHIGLLSSVSGSSSSDVWAASFGGKVKRWDGSSWKVQSTPIPGSIVDAASPTNVWIAGEDAGGADCGAPADHGVILRSGRLDAAIDSARSRGAAPSSPRTPRR